MALRCFLNQSSTSVSRVLFGATKTKQERATAVLRGGSVFVRDMSGRKSLDLSGIYPPIPTSFNGNEDIDYAKLKSNLDIWNKIPFAGYVVQGSNGEYVYLSNKERVDMVGFVRKEVPKDKLVIAGSGCEGTRETVKLTKEMADAGADAVLVTTPCFYKNRINVQAMNKHYTEIANASPVPVILYNVPANTGVEFPPESIAELAKHPNIVGLKDSGGNITYISGIIHSTSQSDFQILAGSASFLMPYLSLGAVGGVCALANVLGEQVCQLYKLCKDRKLDEARELQLKLVKPNGAVTRRFNVPGMKHAMDLYGYYGGPCRSPMTSLLINEAAEIEKSFLEFPRK